MPKGKFLDNMRQLTDFATDSWCAYFFLDDGTIEHLALLSAYSEVKTLFLHILGCRLSRFVGLNVTVS